MNLPLADEVREARAKLERATAAGIAVSKLSSELMQVRLIAQQLADHPDVALPFNEPSILTELSEQWPQLEDLAAASPSTAANPAAGLAMREAQLDLALSTLRPIAAETESLSATMHRLQHKQEHYITDPAWAPLAAELQALDAERASLQAKLNELSQQLLALQPVTTVLVSFIERLGAMLPTLSGDLVGATDAIGAWRTAVIASSFVDTVHQVMLPSPQLQRRLTTFHVGNDPFADSPEHHHAHAARSLVEMRSMADQLVHDQAELTLEVATLQARVDTIREKMLERTG